MSAWEIEASTVPASDDIGRVLVRVRILDADSIEQSDAFIDLPSTDARRLALELLAAAEDADWQTDQAGNWNRESA
jgi:hypothetical protein